MEDIVACPAEAHAVMHAEDEQVESREDALNYRLHINTYIHYSRLFDFNEGGGLDCKIALCSTKIILKIRPHFGVQP